MKIKIGSGQVVFPQFDSAEQVRRCHVVVSPASAGGGVVSGDSMGVALKRFDDALERGLAAIADQLAADRRAEGWIELADGRQLEVRIRVVRT